ncbi:beta-scruin-like isoform X2 [Limulus polyphemus]|uniref:Beta-scruin-like isoform X2 n=1 Tax=Limulus polyphemus TaxID=6850 RepID=A0ABM1TFX1_LIMPO|nr:beta-scruin-like isoform X2 [Limulus polyphemus]
MFMSMISKQTHGQKKKSLPRPLAFCKVLTVRRKIWVLAGCTYKSTKNTQKLVSVSEVHVFNPTNNIWKRQLNLPGPRHSVATCKIGNKVILLGGMTSLDQQAIPDLDIYDIEEQKFKNGATFPCPLTGAVALEIPQERDWVKAKWFWEDPDIDQLNSAATTIQAAYRGYQTRKKYIMKKQTNVEIQERELKQDDSIVTVELFDPKSQNTQYESLESSAEQLFIQEEVFKDIEHIEKEDFPLKIQLSAQPSQKKDVYRKHDEETIFLLSEETPQKTKTQYQTPWHSEEHIFIQKDSSSNIEYEEEDNSLKIKIDDKLSKRSQLEIPVESAEQISIQVIPDKYDSTISSAKESFFTYEESTSSINYQHMQKAHIHVHEYEEFFRLVPQMDQNLRLLSSLEQERTPPKSSFHKEVNFLPTFAESLKRSKHIQDKSFPVIVAVGGIDPQNPNSLATGQTVLRYHPFKDRWEFCGTMPEPRNYHAAVFLNNAIYVSGGYDPERRKYGEMVPCNKMWAFDINSKHWEKKANMMAARACHGMVTIHQKLYVVGGRGGNGRLLASLEEYDLTDDAWRPERPMLFPRMGMMVVIYKKMIWVCGGIVECCPNVNIASLVSNVACYDPLTDQWFSKRSLPEPRAFASAIIVDNEMWLCGGCTGTSSAGNYFVSSPSINVYDHEREEWLEYDVLDVPRHAGAGVNLVPDHYSLKLQPH